VRGVGLFDFLRGKQDEDPILGGRSAEPSGLEVTPVEGGAWSQTSTSHVTAQATGAGGEPMDPASLIRTLQEAGGDPAKLAAELHRSGAPTDDEFAAAKAKLLGST